ncbi:hypothetical protein K1720_01335 [Thermococcus argininiproducens]|uniref:DUF5667 domain-containing protein n=1 Tax=Thermococcus argininiproducens TaxID=2866384 RepID=A0A9E7MA58_9EURY|nr:hypothetical protein [Thermococcus argininiproducens]USH00151.1 hypothetical protein K1720_01335 [Thermococcus argininiproducens]
MKISKKIITLSIFALLLLGSIGLASNVTVSNETTPINGKTETIGNITINMTLNVSLQEKAYGLLLIIERLSNYTGAMISVTANIDNEILLNFNETEYLKESAWMAYNSTDYQLAITLAMEAMEGYRDIIEELMPEKKEIIKNETEKHEELLVEAQEELRRAQEYLSYVEEFLTEASQLGIDVSIFLDLYNQTSEAYKRVAIDISNGNITVLKQDLEIAEELKEKLSEAIEEELIPQMLSMKADEIAIMFISKLNVQLNRTIELMNLIENLTMISNVTYPPGYEKEIKEILEDYKEELREITEEVNSLIEEGEYEEALELISELNEELRDIIKEIREVQKEFYEEYVEEYCEKYKDHSDEENYERYCENSEWESEKEKHKEDDEEEYEDEHYGKYNHTEEYEQNYEEEREYYEGNYTEKWYEDERRDKDKSEDHEKNYTEEWEKEGDMLNPTDDESEDSSDNEEEN